MLYASAPYSLTHLLGYGYHGDFIAAWDDGVLQQAVDQCTDMGGEMRSCGVFQFPENTASCTLENPLPEDIKDENTEGPMQGLPGQCEVQSGPEEAEKGKGATGTSSGGKTGKKSDSDSSKGGDYGSPPASAPAAPLPSSPPVDDKKTGAVFAQVKDAGDNYQAPPSPPSPPAAPTTTVPPVGPAADQAGDVVSTKIWTEGRVVHEEKIVMQEVTVTSDGAKVKRTAEAQAEHVKRHAHRHHHPMQHGVGGRRMR